MLLTEKPSPASETFIVSSGIPWACLHWPTQVSLPDHSSSALGFQATFKLPFKRQEQVCLGRPAGDSVCGKLGPHPP
ncbi:unnamed protein product [Gulo gulo]|uniref:Uncharacterized protein n=1 Tax=Gulo gulo TaxID=48420 RepID=A0A9X9M8Z3_GULGU|nr:unnamed protein product [Gulo gulo]